MIERRRLPLFPLLLAVVLGHPGIGNAAVQLQIPRDAAVQVPSGGDPPVMWSQLDDPSGAATADQAFEATYAAYDSAGADDFYLLEQRCRGDVAGIEIQRLDTSGALQITGSQAIFVDVAFYADAGGEPGAPAFDCQFPARTDFTMNSTGDISIELDCFISTGTYWVSQQVRMDFLTAGQHGWGTRNESVDNPAVWRNPDDGFGTGCVDWEPANAVCGQTGSDMLFALYGSGADPDGIPDECPPVVVPAVGPLGLLLLVGVLAGSLAYLLRRR
jgi:hypothetical protein